MKKLVTLMLALSLGGSQVFAAGSAFTSNPGLGAGLFGGPTPAAQQQAERSPAANIVLGSAAVAMLLYLVSPRGAGSFMETLSTTLTNFISGRSSATQCATDVVNHFTGQVQTAGADMLSSVAASTLTDAQRLQAQHLANARGWSVEATEQYAARLAMQQEHSKVAPMFAVFQQLVGGAQQAQQQSALDQFLHQGTVPANVDAVIGR